MALPTACVMDLTPPTFAGIATLTAEPSGTLLAAWLAATDSSPPIRYRVYIQAATSVGLFSSLNRLKETVEGGLDARIYRDALGDKLLHGETYYVGVRAVDALGNESGNPEFLFAISEGVIDDNCETLAQKISALLETFPGEIVGEVEDDDEYLEGDIDDDEYLEGEIEECD